MMKRILLIFSCFFALTGSLIAQVGDTMNFQMILRDTAEQLLTNQSVGLRFRIIQDSETGTVVYEETHTTTTNSLGIATVNIGAGTPVIGSMNAIDWTTGAYFISTEIDPAGGTAYTLQQTSALNSVPAASMALNTALASTLDYNSLTNLPTTITNAQAEKVDFIEVTNAINLDNIKTAVDLNTAKTGFPGFGTTTGTAFEILWSKIADNAFFNTETVGIGTDANLESSAAGLVIDGGVLFPVNAGLTAEIGVLDYYNLSANSNGFYYTNNLGTIDLYNSTNDIVFAPDTDANVIGNLAVGDGATTNHNFNDDNLVLASATPSILFRDTSSSASFPTADWRIKINDLTDGGADYFSVDHLDSGASTFKIMAEAPTDAFTILANGNVGFQTTTPTEALEVSNSITGSFIGDASNLTNIPGGTASATNSGSTTIKADTNSDTIGAVTFETSNQTQMSISSNGNIAIGTITPTVSLEVDGDAKLDRITTDNLVVNGAISRDILQFDESDNPIAIPPNFTPIDVTDMDVVIYEANATFQYFTLLNATEGQVITIINSGTGTLNFFPGTILAQNIIALGQNESLTMVFSNGSFLVTSLVN